MVQKVCLVLLQAKKKLVTYSITYSVTWICFSLKCSLPMSVFSGYHAANKYDKTKD